MLENKSRFRPDFPEHFRPYISQLRTFTEEDLEAILNDNHKTAREHADEDNIPFNQIHSYWKKDKGLSTYVKIDRDRPDLTKSFIKSCLDELNENFVPFEYKPSKHYNTGRVLRLIITDVHVGMETDKNGYALFGGVWNADELEKRKKSILQKAKLLFEQNLENPFEEIHVIDLGDYMDGWDATTTRGGHTLPQNMDNRQAFKVGTSFKSSLYDELQRLYDVPVKAYNVINDNHSSDFGYMVNESVKFFCESRNPNITVYNLERFMQHYFIGNHCFILCHGKDQQHMKFGLKPHLDPKGKEKIEEYIRYNKIDDRADTITFEKGDSHQQILDYATSDVFDYFNYMALSPASDWVQTNHKMGKSGFNFMIVDKNETNHVLLTTTFKWETKNFDSHSEIN